MDTTEKIHNALEWANKRLKIQGEPISENQRNYIVFALRQQLGIADVKQSLPESPKCLNCFDTGGSWQGEYGHKYVKCTMCGEVFNVV